MLNPFKKVGEFFIDKKQDITEVVHATEDSLHSIPPLVEQGQLTIADVKMAVASIEELVKRLNETQASVTRLKSALAEVVGKE